MVFAVMREALWACRSRSPSWRPCCSAARWAPLNGVVTAYVRIPSFITTLAALSAFKGLAFMFNNGSPGLPGLALLEPLFYGRLLGMPLPLFYVVVFFAAAHWLMRYTRSAGRSTPSAATPTRRGSPASTSAASSSWPSSSPG